MRRSWSWFRVVGSAVAAAAVTTPLPLAFPGRTRSPMPGAGAALAQVQPIPSDGPSDPVPPLPPMSPTVPGAPGGTTGNFVMAARTASTWVDATNPATNVVLLDGDATLALGRSNLKAERAVVWITPARDPSSGEQDVQVALLGGAEIAHPGQMRRTGETLYVTAAVRGTIRITAERRRVENLDQSEPYRAAVELRKQAQDLGGPPDLGGWLLRPLPPGTPAPATQPARRRNPVLFSADSVKTETTRGGTMAVVLTGAVKLFQRREGGELIELQADRAVLFTPLRSMKDLEGSKQFTRVEDAVTAAYVEGDVRIVMTPAERRRADQRLWAERAYYDFETDRAIMTDVVMHTVEPQRGIPVVLRAEAARQLSLGEFRATDVRLSQSSFHTPSYHVGMDRAYVRQTDTGEETYGTLTEFWGTGVTFNAQDVPFFWLPAVGGYFTEKGMPLRNLGMSGGSKYGFGVSSDWGVLELLGKVPPPDIDLELSLDYFTARGPAAGLDAKYARGILTDERQPWSFDGRFEGYFVYDDGKDDLGRRRLDVTPEQEARYRLVWEHQHILPDGWQLQLTGALVSDPTFQEEWFRRDFQRQRPLDTAIYIKQQDRSEAFTFLYGIQPNDFVTTSDLLQENAEIERVPEVGYHRIGDVLGESGDGPTFFSHNSVSHLRFQPSRAEYFEDVGGLGFRAADTAGLPSFGQTGTPTNPTWRADLRQEVDWPFTAGPFRFVPYVFGRYTVYSESPDSSSTERLMAGGGLRLGTAFWKVDDRAESDLFDIHRVRHVVEPSLNLFASAASADRNDVLVYDEDVDRINDISAVQVALRQRWQTKRGGPGRWRSVDFLTLNLFGNFFFNKPTDAQLAPVGFRGLYFDSAPEASIPRNSINADLTWRLSDTTAVLADASYNLDANSLAAGGIGLAVSRGDRLGYYVGVRYMDSEKYTVRLAGGALEQRDTRSILTTVGATYQLAPKYSLSGRFSFDFGEREQVLTYFGIIRQFDRWTAALTIKVDYLGDESGIYFNLWPEGLSVGGGSERLQQVFQ